MLDLRPNAATRELPRSVRRPVRGLALKPVRRGPPRVERPRVEAPRLDPPLPELAARRGLGYWLLPPLAIFLFAAGVAHVGYLKISNIDYFWYRPWANTYSLLISFYILSRFFLSAFYRPPKNVAYRPTVSAVIACKNEERSIARTIHCLYASDYPAQLFEGLAINDGSTP